MFSRKNLAVSTFLLLLPLIDPISQAFGGVASTGGSFYDGDHVNPWFFGEKPVEYCLKMPAPNTELGQIVRDEIEDWRELVRSSFGHWQGFLRRHQLDQAYDGPEYFEQGHRFKYFFADKGKRSPSLNFVEVPQCDAKNGQIEILLGVLNPQVKQYLQENPDNAAAVAVREKFGHQSYRSGGSLWIQPPACRHCLTQVKRRLMLHEIGHVFGFPHDSLAIMREHLASRVIHAPLPSCTIADPSKPQPQTEVPSQTYTAEIESSAWRYRFPLNEDLILTERYPFTMSKLVPCVSKGFAGPEEIPPRIRSALQLNPKSAYAISVRVLKATKASQTLELKLIEQQGQTRLLQGSFETSPELSERRELFGPRLCTRWFIDQPAPLDQAFFCGNLDRAFPANQFFPAEGSLTLADGSIVPASLELRRGLLLKVFDKASKHWATFESLPAEYEASH